MKKALIITLAAIIAVLLGFAIANAVNEQVMNKYIDSFAAVEIENRLVPSYDEDGAPYFVTDGDFKVMQLTDIHIGGGVLSVAKDKKAINAVAAMITAEKPDLVIVTGDISFAVLWSGTINNRYAHALFSRLMENLGVYWTVAFGNHDSEACNFYARSEVAKIYENENFKYCLFDRGPEKIFGECNHIINVRQSDGLISKSFIIMDSNSYTDEDPLGIKWIYDNIHADQVEWYEGQIEKMNAHNAALGSSEPVESLLFIHIPLLEVKEAYYEYLAAGECDTENVKHLFGKVGESDPYVFSSNEPSDMFNKILELGSTKAIFFGHDHLNNMIMDYKGVALCYSYSIDYFAYFGIAKIGSQRGCTIINCSSDGVTEVLHENYYQDKYQPLYEKEVVDLTN